MKERMSDAKSKGVLLYDGACPFCIGQAERLERWVHGRVRLESFREPGVLSRYPAITLAQCEDAIHLIERDGRVSRGAEAIARTLMLRPALAPLGFFYRVPVLRGVLDWGYALVARNRFRLRGRSAVAATAGAATGAGAAVECSDAACRAHTKAS